MPRLLHPWSTPGRLWRSFAYVAIGVPVATIAFTVMVSLLATTFALLVTLVLAIPMVWVTFVAGRAISKVERSRAVSLLDVELVDPVAPLEARGWFRRLAERCKSKARWRELAYSVFIFPVAMLSFALATAAWCGSLALALAPLYVGSLPGGTAKFWLFEVGPGVGALGASAVGLAGLVLVAPWATVGAAQLQVGLTGLLIGRQTRSEVEEALRRSEQTRSAAVDSAEAERRRIERDLHDGAQQRLVALAAQLGEAREKLATDPAAAEPLVAGAHEEAKAALKEIRDLVRGIHPVILEDRGLDAALSAVVARSPIPVRLEVDVAPRPPAAVESTAYFVVNEALTNVARHAQATRASVAVARAGDRLVIEVHDDGVGGADASLGSGLQGLRERVASHGGTLHVISPDGGPTTISVEVPCAS